MLTAQKIYSEYNRRFGSFLPISEDKVEKFLKKNTWLKPRLESGNMNQVVDLLFDWVGANQEYEEGAEVCW